jgi:hypothetical protein
MKTRMRSNMHEYNVERRKRERELHHGKDALFHTPPLSLYASYYSENTILRRRGRRCECTFLLVTAIPYLWRSEGGMFLFEYLYKHVFPSLFTCENAHNAN